MNYTRRTFISKTLATTALFSTGAASTLASGCNLPGVATGPIPSNESGNFSIHVFSKMLHWLNYSEMAVFAREAGFDGVDLTVRPKGHVLPERASTDLPKAVAEIRKAGLKIEMITTAITRADEPYTEDILKAAAAAGIKHYRMGWINYDPTASIPENLTRITKQLEELAALNGRYKMIAEYQNHSGANFGSPVWDLYTVLKQINSPWLGSQYDIYHATVEAANAWVLGLELLKPFIRTIDVKDFLWGMRDGKQGRRDVPLGQGNVDFPKFFDILKMAKIAVPISLHVEYDLGGAQYGETQTSMPRERILNLMRNDVSTLKTFIS